MPAKGFLTSKDNPQNAVPFLFNPKEKKWIVKQGESLCYIAAIEYGDPADWRLIADANNIENPLALIPGQELVIPAKE